MVLERVARALDLAFVGASAKLVGELVALREPRRAERVALREQAARRIGHDLATIAVVAVVDELLGAAFRSEEHTSELQSLMRISYAVFCLKQTTPYTSTPSTLSSTTRPTQGTK